MWKISVTAQNRSALVFTFALTFGYFVVELVGGILTNSLALLADAAHMLTDVAGLGLALFATWMSRKPATPTKTYGYYRVEILAALANAVVLFLMSFYILYEAYRRLAKPPEVASVPMLVVAVVGLVVIVHQVNLPACSYSASCLAAHWAHYRVTWNVPLPREAWRGTGPALFPVNEHAAKVASV